ncbi:MAG: cytochrome-c oxidase, cbb3-type subunit II [Pseudomonadota bacterium]
MAHNNENMGFQEKTETNVWFLTIVLALGLTVAGIVEIVPLFYLPQTMEELTEKEDNIRPYAALELEGRDIYIREGCYTCHSQMIRPFRDEKERYGHYSLAVESKYDHPFQWGSKRTGPDLARVGGKYSDEWHIQHLMCPKCVVPESVMPNYPWLVTAKVNHEKTAAKMKALRSVGVPYTDADIAGASDAVVGKTEMQAVVAYLQVLGTMVNFEEGKDYRQ